MLLCSEPRMSRTGSYSCEAPASTLCLFRVSDQEAMWTLDKHSSVCISKHSFEFNDEDDLESRQLSRP